MYLYGPTQLRTTLAWRAIASKDSGDEESQMSTWNEMYQLLEKRLHVAHRSVADVITQLLPNAFEHRSQFCLISS